MPGRMSATEREAAIRKVEAGYADDLREFNVSACERVKGHDNLLPYIALDAIAMPGEEGAVPSAGDGRGAWGTGREAARASTGLQHER